LILPDPGLLANLYTLWYRSGSHPNLHKNFFFLGDISEATKEGQRHCSAMNYQFIYVKHFLSLFSLDESRRPGLKNKTH
jgi:hypothetical protein